MDFISSFRYNVNQKNRLELDSDVVLITRFYNDENSLKTVQSISVDGESFSLGCYPFTNYILKDFHQCSQKRIWEAEATIKGSLGIIPKDVPFKDLKFLTDEDVYSHREELVNKFDELSGLNCRGVHMPTFKIEKMRKSKFGEYFHRNGALFLSDTLTINKFSETICHELYHSREPMDVKKGVPRKAYKETFMTSNEILARAYGEAFWKDIKAILTNIYLRNQVKAMFERSEEKSLVDLDNSEKEAKVMTV